MSADGAGLRWIDIQARAFAGWRWWTDELRALVPKGLREAFAPSWPVIAIDVTARDVTVRRLSDRKPVEIARFPIAAFDATGLRSALAPWLARSRLVREPV